MKFFVTGAVLAMALSTPAMSASISFDEFGAQPTTFGAQTNVLDTDYGSEGITFSGGWEILDEGSNFGVMAISGSNFAAYNTNVPGISNTLLMTFDSVIESIGGFLGNSSGNNWSIATFLGGTQVGALSVSNVAGRYAEFALSGSFDAVSITGTSSAGVLENLTFEEADLAPVPLPATGLMLLAGLAGLAVTRRRRP